MNYPFVISIPHCANRVPADIRRQMALSDEEIRDSADFGTSRIFGCLPARAVIMAEWSRLAADLNRAPDKRGPKGVVAETDYRGRSIYPPGSLPDEKEIQRRVKQYFTPYHESLSLALQEPGIRGLFDCHSLNGTGPADAPDAGQRRKDIIISNNGKKDCTADPELGNPTCPPDKMEIIKSVFQQQGFSVSVNDPYKGGYITVHYGRMLMDRGGFAVQIEMNQQLYMPEGAVSPEPEKLEDVRKRIACAFETIAGF